MADPKYVVSAPSEPEPVEATAKPCVFRKCCKACTSAPDIPIFRSRLNVVETTTGIADAVEMVVAGVIGIVVVATAVVVACDEVEELDDV